MIKYLKGISYAGLAVAVLSAPARAQVPEVLPDDLQGETVADAATSGFGLGFEDLLSIVLTQLTYQDPLKPIDNFEFVSQLAQFSQIQQTETMSATLESILEAENLGRASSLLGRVVDVPAGATVLSGTVTAISFDNGVPRVTIETQDGRTISNINTAGISQVRTGE